MKVFVVNCGSSSIKYQLFDMTDESVLARGLLERVGLRDRWDHTPGRLSGGERQRLAVARALVNDAPLVLADEPTGNLDHETGRSILDLFEGIVREGKTVVVVTHDQEVARRAKVVFRLRDGVLVGEGG